LPQQATTKPSDDLFAYFLQAGDAPLYRFFFMDDGVAARL